MLTGLTFQTLDAHVEWAAVVRMQSRGTAQQKRFRLLFKAGFEDSQSPGTACTGRSLMS